MVSMNDISRPLSIPSMGGSDDLEAQKDRIKFITKILKYVYWIVGGGSLVALCYILYNNYSRCAAAVLIFLGGILALYYYYIKWFFSTQSSTWPTGQSLCPDYLTPVSPGFQRNFDGSAKVDSAGMFKCLDFVGVSTNGALQKSSPASVDMALANPNYHVTITPKMTAPEIKAMLKAKGLTWISMFGDDN